MVASSETQALTRTYRPSAPVLSKTTRQMVPPFVQKLYELVNASSTDELIRWSDTGDSFFVFEHERFANDVLPRFFKHRNFSSFVRQLNMYGFHKIPHLQQGVLKSDTETEFWNFEHPNFHRGQPDLLCLVTRKNSKGGSQQNVDLTDGDVSLPSQGSAQLLDVNSIVGGITAIKRHQQAISADLNELKTSNQHLWQEALIARERYKTQQDTINRILKFWPASLGPRPLTMARTSTVTAHRHHSSAVVNACLSGMVPRIASIKVWRSSKWRMMTIRASRSQCSPMNN
ncbi:hypothetical protein BC826DRAFT_585135 [Russula brevipes]|nr:hypothetical protein BC826DRAFT_585135 [Russula brevipes]